MPRSTLGDVARGPFLQDKGCFIIYADHNDLIKRENKWYMGKREGNFGKSPQEGLRFSAKVEDISIRIEYN